MDVTTLPFNRFLGLEKGASSSGLLVSLPPLPQYTNHLGTVHASALLAVAEAGSAEFLLRHFGDIAEYVPVVRRLEVKFRKSARGRVSARASIEGDALNRLSGDLRTKGRALIRVSAEVIDEGGMVVLSGVVESFIPEPGPPPNFGRLLLVTSPTSATGTGWERTSWYAVQRAAWEALLLTLP